jgi:S-(hydroxymethyl)glutathione dehydrogenase/alcohol dehydrogenase
MKRDAALTLGATDVVDPSAVDPIEAVKMLSGGRGADYAFEVIGTAATIRQAVATARPGGTAVMVGVPRLDSDVAIPAMSVLEEKTILGCVYGSAQVRRDFPRLISLIEQGRLDVGAMVTRTMPLEQVNEAIRAMQDGEVIRSVLV